MLALASAIALTACGQSSEQAVRETVADTFAAVGEGDAERLCELLSSEAELKLGSSAHGEPPFACRRDAARQLEWLEPYRSGAKARIDRIATRGDLATVALRLPNGDAATLRAREEDGSWRLNGLFDASLSVIQASTIPSRRDRVPIWRPTAAKSADGSVTVRDARPADRPPCLEIGSGDLERENGSCILHVAADALDASLWGPFGVAWFGTCTFEYRVHFEGDGDAWVVDFKLDGPSPCDAIACRTRDLRSIPWPATVERDPAGAIRLHVEDACVDTCMGRFEGDWTIELTERPEAWRLRFDSPLGTGGWRVDGAATSVGKPIAIE